MRRLTFILAALPWLIYACKSDTTAAPETAPVSTEPGTEPAPSPEPGLTPSPAEDGGVADGGTVAPCVGNPLGAAAPKPTKIADGRFLDGPQWITDPNAGPAGGFLVYSEVDNQVIVRNSAAGGERHELRELPLENLPIGNARSGQFIYTALSKTRAAGGGGAILKMRLDGSEPSTLSAGGANSPNDIVASSKGNLYFTDPGFQTDGVSTGVYMMTPDGKVSPITQFDGGLGMRADGIALSQDETALYVGYFDMNSVSRYSVDANGNAKDAANLPIVLAQHPTGLAIDTANNLWVAEDADGDPAHGLVEVFDATGKKWGEIPFADARPTGIAFGGADGKTVFVTTERGDVNPGSLFSLPSACAGVR